MSFLLIASSLIISKYKTLTSKGISYPKIFFKLKRILLQNIWIFGQVQKMWEWLASFCPHCFQHCCCDWDVLLLIWGVMKKRIRLFQPNSLHLLELVVECCVFQISCQSSCEISVSNSFFNVIYSLGLLMLFELGKSVYCFLYPSISHCIEGRLQFFCSCAAKK